MKKIYALLVAVICVSASSAQNANAVVFSEMGEKFTLFLNGEKQNAAPQSNVKLSGLTGEFYQARVDFEDAKLPDFAENNFRVAKGIEVTYIIKLNKKGAYVLRFAGETPVGSSSATAEPVKTDDDVKRIAEVDDMTEETTQTTGGIAIQTLL